MARFLVIGLLLSLPFALAQRYTVQTVALKDYREALATAQQLRDLHFDAYVDFALFEGQQYARVRVGCFEDKASAEALAAFLKSNVTAEAVAAEASANTPTQLCLRREIGFMLPPSWDVLQNTPSAITFWVELEGQRGFLVFDGQHWRLAQSEAEAEGLMSAGPTLAAATPARFQALTQDGRPLILYDGLVVANAQLLWQRGRAAVVLEGAAVVAYHVSGETP